MGLRGDRICPYRICRYPSRGALVGSRFQGNRVGPCLPRRRREICPSLVCSNATNQMLVVK
jgi:hypothetical protein